MWLIVLLNRSRLCLNQLKLEIQSVHSQVLGQTGLSVVVIEQVGLLVETLVVFAIIVVAATPLVEVHEILYGQVGLAIGIAAEAALHKYDLIASIRAVLIRPFSDGGYLILIPLQVCE